MLRANIGPLTTCPRYNIVYTAVESYDGHWAPYFKLFLRVGGAGVWRAQFDVMDTYSFLGAVGLTIVSDCGATHSQPAILQYVVY